MGKSSVRSLLYAGLGAIALMDFSPVTERLIHGESMEPAIYDGDSLLYITGPNIPLEAGDIVVFRCYIDDEVHKYVKRIGHAPGETFSTGSSTVMLSDNDFWVLGDNAETSYDSRHFGPVRREDIYGKMLSVKRNGNRAESREQLQAAAELSD